MSISPYDPNNSLWEGYDRMPPAPPVTRQTATFQANGFSERVTVPLLKAVITGVSTGLLCGLLIGAFHIAVNVWWTMPIVTLSVFLATFWGSSNRGQWLIERLTGADLNHDGYIGQPAPLPPALSEKVHIELVQDNGRQGDFIDLPASPQQLKALASGLVNQNRQFALSLWVGNGQLFSRTEFENLRAEMIERGLAKWKNEKSQNQGCELTRAGLAVMRYIASDRYSPPPLLGK